MLILGVFFWDPFFSKVIIIIDWFKTIFRPGGQFFNRIAGNSEARPESERPRRELHNACLKTENRRFLSQIWPKSGFAPDSGFSNPLKKQGPVKKMIYFRRSRHLRHLQPLGLSPSEPPWKVRYDAAIFSQNGCMGSQNMSFGCLKHENWHFSNSCKLMKNGVGPMPDFTRQFEGKLSTFGALLLPISGGQRQ